MDHRHRQDQHWSDYGNGPHAAHHPPPHHHPHPHSIPHPQDPVTSSHPPPGSWPHPHPHPHMVHMPYAAAGSPPPLPPPAPPGMYLTPIHYNVAPYSSSDFYKAVPARQRSTIACLSCRKRKIRCEQREDGRCENCMRINQNCEFVPVSSQKVGHGNFYKPAPAGQSPTGPPPPGLPGGHHHPSSYGPYPGQGAAPPPVHAHHPGQYPGADGPAGGYAAPLPPLYPTQPPQQHHSQAPPPPPQPQAQPPHHSIHQPRPPRVLIDPDTGHPVSRHSMDGPSPGSGPASARGRDVLSIRSLVSPHNYDGPSHREA